MLKSSFCDYSDSYILVSGTITIAALAAGGENNCIEVVFHPKTVWGGGQFDPLPL